MWATSRESNCPSASRLTIRSAPPRIARSIPSRHTGPSPGRPDIRTTVAPARRASSAVASVLASSTTMTSTSSTPAICRGIAETTAPTVAASSCAGMVTASFTGGAGSVAGAVPGRESASTESGTGADPDAIAQCAGGDMKL